MHFIECVPCTCMIDPAQRRGSRSRYGMHMQDTQSQRGPPFKRKTDTCTGSYLYDTITHPSITTRQTRAIMSYITQALMHIMQQIIKFQIPASYSKMAPLLIVVLSLRAHGS